MPKNHGTGNNKYIKELEEKVEHLEGKVMKLNMELAEYKNLLKVSDITKSPSDRFQGVLDDFNETEKFLKGQMLKMDGSKEVVKETWTRIMDSVGTNIGPTGSVRRKLIKRAFKVIIRQIMPEQLGYLSYLMGFEEKANKRERGHMKKLSQQGIIHYCKDKGFTPLDMVYAILRPGKEEYELMQENSNQWKNLRIKAKETVRTLLKCRYEIFNIEIKLDELVCQIYRKVRPEITAGFFKTFYTQLSMSKISIFDMYDIPKKKFIFSNTADNDECALTDSEEDES